MEKKTLDEITQTVVEIEKLEFEYWNKKRFWSRAELLEFIKKEVTIDDIVDKLNEIIERLNKEER